MKYPAIKPRAVRGLRRKVKPKVRLKKSRSMVVGFNPIIVFDFSQGRAGESAFPIALPASPPTRSRSNSTHTFAYDLTFLAIIIPRSVEKVITR
jgi:hypothetical protein